MNEKAPATGARYVLYWMQMYRRMERNHALNHAVEWAERLDKPLVVYEGLRLDYRWASARFHQFILEGMAANLKAAKTLGLTYWPFVETPDQPARGLLRKLAEDACLIITDDFPGFIVPSQSLRLAKQIDVPLVAVDGNSVIPLSLLGQPVFAAAHLRPRIHKAFAEAWPHRAIDREIPKRVRVDIEPPFSSWNGGGRAKIAGLTASLPIDQRVPVVEDSPGGTPAARERLREFLSRRLPNYADGRNEPASLEDGNASGLSPYLHFGHIGIEEVIEAVLESTGPWSLQELDLACRGKREGFFSRDVNVNSFLDEAITWRDVGYHWHRHRGADIASLDRALPDWAKRTLQAHQRDPRPHLYGMEEFEAGATHDRLWNAAQRELVATGRIHNYLRMLWGKKVIEWSATPEEAYQTLEHLNNKYALDGRDPNSYTGILWCFGLFDRPWVERPIFGTVRYMSSDNTARKFKLNSYFEYVAFLPTIADVREGLR